MYVCMYSTYMQCPQESEEGIGSPKTGIIDTCEPPCGCWGLNLVPLEGQQVLLGAEPSLIPEDCVVLTQSFVN